MQSGLSPTSSTQIIHSGLTVEPDLTGDYVVLEHEEFEDDYEICEKVSEKELEKLEQEIASAPPPEGAYHPSELNRILLKKFKEKFSYQEGWFDPNFATLNYHILSDKNQKFIIFGVLAEYKTLKDFELPSLNEGLLILKTLIQKEIYQSEDIVLIPVTEPFRGIEARQGHFRLLAFANNTITYYDSKSAGYHQVMRFIQPLRSAAELTLEEVAEQMTAAVGFLQKIKIMAKSAVNLQSRYAACYGLVEKTCKKHFPELPFSEDPRAQQAWHEHTKCGENAIETSLQIACNQLSATPTLPRITVGGP